jgi:hypothetical protein
MLTETIPGASTRAQLADSEAAILAFAVTVREPDRDVHPDDLAWWLERQERLEIRSELAASGLL